MIAPHLISFFAKHHASAGEHFATLVTELCEALDSGSSCLPLEHSSLELLTSQTALATDQEGSVVGSPGQDHPLILTPQNKLYLNRYYAYEREIAENVKGRLGEEPILSSTLESDLAELFGTLKGNDQAEAARKAFAKSFSIISGGPGTGKTTTVVKILRLLHSAGQFAHPSEVLLLAPTGKAADRLRQSVVGSLTREGIDPSSFPTETSTIHRALGYIPQSVNFRHNAQNPLRAKLLVVDESSMVDLSLMAKLFRATASETKIILLGDQHQLTSVEVGSVLSDLIDNEAGGQINEAITILRKSYRNKGDIYQCCEAIREGDSGTALATVNREDAESEGRVTRGDLPSQLRAPLTPFVTEHWLPILTDQTLSHKARLDLVDQFRILTPTHKGSYGIESINHTVEGILRKAGIDTGEQWYEGRSVIIQQNDHTLGLYNGDTGLCVRDEEGELKVAFLSELEESGTVLHSTTILPAVNTAWALTIHRTQGSEYDKLLLILPELSTDNPLVTRELLYTGLSRAKTMATIWASESTLTATIENQATRASGLKDLL